MGRSQPTRRTLGKTARRSLPPCVLTIAGSDSGGGAGIQADARTIHALGGFAATAVSAITAQNTRGIYHWRPIPASLLFQQILAVIEDLPIRAVKTGLLSGPSAIRAVLKGLRGRPQLPLIVDPVIGSTSGTRFLSAAGLRVLREELIPRSTLVTPNWPEAEALTGVKITNIRQAEAAARMLIKETGCTAVLVKGGHAPGKICVDLLILEDDAPVFHRHPRIDTANTHGTGCVLSAAIATQLAHGCDLATAVSDAIAFLEAALLHGRGFDWGGQGPALV